jgi:hypothetical protein
MQPGSGTSSLDSDGGLRSRERARYMPEDVLRPGLYQVGAEPAESLSEPRSAPVARSRSLHRRTCPSSWRRSKPFLGRQGRQRFARNGRTNPRPGSVRGRRRRHGSGARLSGVRCRSRRTGGSCSPPMPAATRSRCCGSCLVARSCSSPTVSPPPAASCRSASRSTVTWCVANAGAIGSNYTGSRLRPNGRLQLAIGSVGAAHNWSTWHVRGPRRGRMAVIHRRGMPMS